MGRCFTYDGLSPHTLGEVHVFAPQLFLTGLWSNDFRLFSIHFPVDRLAHLSL